MSIKLNYPSHQILDNMDLPGYRRSGQLKSSLMASYPSKQNPETVLKALSDRSVNLDGLLAFPINWNSYLKNQTFVNQGQLGGGGPRRINQKDLELKSDSNSRTQLFREDSNKSMMNSLNSSPSSSSSSSTSSSSASSSIPSNSPTTPNFDYDFQDIFESYHPDYENEDYKFCSLSEIQSQPSSQSPPTPTLQTIPLPPSESSLSKKNLQRINNGRKRRFDRPDSMFFVNSLNF